MLTEHTTSNKLIIYNMCKYNHTSSRQQDVQAPTPLLKEATVKVSRPDLAYVSRASVAVGDNGT